MITIEIPESNYRQTESNKFLSDLLSEIKEKGECKLFHYGCGTSLSWEQGYTFPHNCTGRRIPLSDDSYNEVIFALHQRGYAIIKGSVIAAGQYITIKG